MPDWDQSWHLRLELSKTKLLPFLPKPLPLTIFPCLIWSCQLFRPKTLVTFDKLHSLLTPIFKPFVNPVGPTFKRSPELTLFSSLLSSLTWTIAMASSSPGPSAYILAPHTAHSSQRDPVTTQSQACPSAAHNPLMVFSEFSSQWKSQSSYCGP